MSPAALDVIDCLPTMDELDSELLVEELSKDIVILDSKIITLYKNKGERNDWSAVAQW